MRKFTKRSTALVTAGVVAATGGAAYAAWLFSGTGTAQASAGSATLTVSDVTVSPAFGPGSTNNLTFTVTNPNAFPVLITGITGPTVTSSLEGDGCNASNVTVTPGGQPTATNGLALGAAGSQTASSTLTYTGKLSMVADPEDDCQGHAFNISVLVNGQSNA
ncbi:hypothetical protein [Actinoplanes xinjiangensis]|uniref:Camelysin-like metallo-endopeptidase n=1 Tax=Actinoplanes xinjiangensis TaxID=512350 RepID=A0A316FP72_9ACTN|nr:hypothetical protein [Actinoplanes xinjiangensis]PWK50658.1 hypothetical protein BC793_103546 [Actinoplanes xinjiangensis]GIF36546.1 hypothetical protein Axi01nite_08570 [Actinoplanes xinjiangensis]